MSYETYEVQVNSNGTQFWFQNGKRHRTDGPAVICANGNQCWYLNDKLHRADGPADIWAAGSQFWYLNGQLHRADGPAVVWANGDQCWWLNGETMSEAEHAAAVAKSQSPCDGKTVEIDGKKYRLTAV